MNSENEIFDKFGNYNFPTDIKLTVSNTVQGVTDNCNLMTNYNLQSQSCTYQSNW